MDPRAHSGAGALGLLQVMPGTARSVGLTAYEPGANVLAGARYLRQLTFRKESTVTPVEFLALLHIGAAALYNKRLKDGVISEQTLGFVNLPFDQHVQLLD